MLVTSSLSAVHYTMIDASRTALVWAIDLCITYFAPSTYKEFGESWNAYSKLQAFGFVVLLCGQCVYSGLVRLPFPNLYPPEEVMEVFVNSPPCSLASAQLATPLPPFSPPDAIRKSAFGKTETPGPRLVSSSCCATKKGGCAGGRAINV
ncbi:unnamed protein product [Amoebophrya sp. A25]|nr:unnamed protein product [Amoebophrya sp. A25]|eukprot:GSA25T00008706001.1